MGAIRSHRAHCCHPSHRSPSSHCCPSHRLCWKLRLWCRRPSHRLCWKLRLFCRRPSHCSRLCRCPSCCHCPTHRCHPSDPCCSPDRPCRCSAPCCFWPSCCWPWHRRRSCLCSPVVILASSVQQSKDIFNCNKITASQPNTGYNTRIFMNKKISLWNEFEFLVLSTHHVHSSE